MNPCRSAESCLNEIEVNPCRDKGILCSPQDEAMVREVEEEIDPTLGRYGYLS